MQVPAIWPHSTVCKHPSHLTQQHSVGPLAHRNRSDFCDLRLRCPSRTPEIANDFRDNPESPILAFLEKSKGFSPKRQGVFLFAEPLKSLEKRGKTHKKARKIGKQKKQGNRKKQGLEGQGRQSSAALRFKGATESR